MRTLLLLLLLTLTLAAFLLGGASASTNEQAEQTPTSFLDFSVPDLRGHQVSMREFSAFRVILVVNVASDCGYTDKNYRELQVRRQRNAMGSCNVLYS